MKAAADNSFVLRGERIVLPEGMRAAAIQVRGGRIEQVVDYNAVPAHVPVLEAGDLVVLPGLVDTHVHVNEPGRTEWEGFDSATRSAAAGGVTTIVDMPLNSVPATTSAAGFEAKLASARGRVHVDVGFWGGVVPGNVVELEGLASRGVLGFKCFLSPSGVDEFQHVAEADLCEAMPVLARLGLPLLVHAELPALLRQPDPTKDPRDHATWLASRPPESERAAIAMLIDLASRFAARIHVVHLADGEAAPLLDAARDAGVPLTVETCPHYLTFAAEEIPARATAFKCAPPLRGRENRERLWKALASGSIDLVATDHSPAPPALKHLDDGDFISAWGGIASIQLGLRAAWTGAASRDIPLERVVAWMAGAPAALAGLQHRKGSIAPGRDADLVLFDPAADSVVAAAALHHRHPVTPYAGMCLRGAVKTTILRGEVVYQDGALVSPARGSLLLPAASSSDARIAR